MIQAKSISAAVALTLALCLSPTAGDAAWWPWSKRAEKVAPAAPTPPADVAPTGDPAAAVPAGTDRLDRIETQMRTLTGEVEQLTYQVRQLQDQLTRVQGNADPGTAKPKKLAATLPAPSPPAPASGMLVIAADPAGVAATDTAPAPAAPMARLAAPGTVAAAPAADQPIDLTVVARTDPSAALPAPAPVPAIPPKADVLASLGDPRADYESAYNNILTGNYDRAEASFRVFLSAHPDDEHASDAQYWLGESLFARGKYREAAIEFLNGHNAYPDSPKAPDTLLKLGLSLAGLGERDAACQTYLKVLKQYPQASKSLRQRVAVEQASASC